MATGFLSTFLQSLQDFSYIDLELGEDSLQTELSSNPEDTVVLEELKCDLQLRTSISSRV